MLEGSCSSWVGNTSNSTASSNALQSRLSGWAVLSVVLRQIR